MSCGEGHGLGKDLELWCTPSAHPPTLLHGFLGVSSAGLACCWCILRLASLPLQLSQMWGSQCSWNACTGVLGGCCIQSPSTGCLCSLQLVLALAMHQPPWHQLWFGQGWHHGLCHPSVEASTVQHSFPFREGPRPASGPGQLQWADLDPWVHRGLRGKSHTCICVQGSLRAGLGWDMVFALRSRQARSV